MPSPSKNSLYAPVSRGRSGEHENVIVKWQNKNTTTKEIFSWKEKILHIQPDSYVCLLLLFSVDFTHMKYLKGLQTRKEVFWSIKAVHFIRYLSGCPLIWIHLHFCSISFKARSKLCKNRLKEDGGNGTVSFAHFTRILLLLGRKHRVTKPVFN